MATRSGERESTRQMSMGSGPRGRSPGSECLRAVMTPPAESGLMHAPFGLKGADAIPKGCGCHPVQWLPASATREEAHTAGPRQGSHRDTRTTDDSS
jgi:hypothetical protein